MEVVLDTSRASPERGSERGSEDQIEVVSRIIQANVMSSLLQNCYITNWRYI